MLKYLAIAVGGALGSLARYSVSSFVASRLGTRFPYGTLLVNITACIIIGFTLTVLARRSGLDPLWRFFIPIGFIGAYSTFSTFEWEIFTGITEGSFSISALYLVASVVLGLIAIWLGTALGRLLS